MIDKKGRGGEPKAVRLLELAHAELLQVLLPQLQGDHRYRARLIANALRIAAGELNAGDEAEILNRLADVAAPALVHSSLPEGTALRDALRQGALDGDRKIYELLVHLTEVRQAALG